MAPSLQGHHADGNVQPVGERASLPGAAVGVEVVQELDGVAALLALLGRVGVLDGLRDTQPAAIVERQVDRLPHVRLGGDELHLEARRHVELLQLLLRRKGIAGDDVHRRTILRRERKRKHKQDKKKGTRTGKNG